MREVAGVNLKRLQEKEQKKTKEVIYIGQIVVLVLTGVVVVVVVAMVT